MSRVEIHASDDTDDLDSIIAVKGDESDDETIHSDMENPVVDIPISDQLFNKGQNQLEIIQVNYVPITPKIIKPFPNNSASKQGKSRKGRIASD